MRPRPLRVLSLCSGISATSVAWKPLGMEIVGFAEIDAFACHVLAQRCGATAPKYLPEGKVRSVYANIKGGTVINFGDLMQMSDDDLRALGVVDILEGGTPCQPFSVAGMADGFDDPRGLVTLAFAQLAHRMRKINKLRYVVWENVNAVLGHKSNAFGSFLAEMVGGCDGPLVPPRGRWTRAGHASGPAGEMGWRVLDAQFWGVPQRRKRLFAVVRLGERGPCPGEILGERGPRGGGIGTGRTEAGMGGHHGDPGPTGGGAGGAGRVIAYIGGQGWRAGSIGASEKTSPTLKAAQSGSTLVPFVSQERPDGGWLVRNLMPVECERLMGLPEGWTEVEYRGASAADTPRYTAIGNSIAVPCLSWIGKRLVEEHHRYWSKYDARAA